MSLVSEPKTLEATPRGQDIGLAVPAVLPGLDGLRAFSILLVMLSHTGLQNVVPGVFGVTMFFFVSGFLITSLLLSEYRRAGSIGIGSFYMRRLLRLYPPLVVSIAVTALFYAAIGQKIDPLGVVAALAYLANYAAIFRPEIMTNLGGQLWSLAVEEHFYFVYPLLLAALLPHRSRIAAIILAICALSLAVRFHVEFNHPAIAQDYTGKATETRIDSILFGALAALIWWTAPARRWLERYWFVLFTGAVALLLVSFLWRNPVMRETVRYTAQGLALIPLVLAVTVSGRLPFATALLEMAPARWIGRHSYSLYLWHLLAFEAAELGARALGAGKIAGYLGGWGLAFLLAALSYRYVETPFFALRKRFGSNVTSVDAVQG